MSEYICEGCKQPLTDCGPIGYACLNKECTYEKDQAIKWVKVNKERRIKANFNEWLNEIEGFGLRLERLYEDLNDYQGDNIEIVLKWLEAAYNVGYEDGRKNR